MTKKLYLLKNNRNNIKTKSVKTYQGVVQKTSRSSIKKSLPFSFELLPVLEFSNPLDICSPRKIMQSYIEPVIRNKCGTLL